MLVFVAGVYLPGIMGSAATLKPLVMGKRGVVAAGHPLVAEAGLRILEKGGNAVNLLIGPRQVDKIVHLTESGTIVADPKFINPSADPKVADFRRQPGSPALKAANSTPAPSPI